MQPIVRPVLLLHSDARLKELLGEMPGQLYRLTEVPDWTALRESLARAPLTATAVVDPLDRNGRPSDELRQLLDDHPSRTVLAALRVDPQDAETLLTLLSWGVADFVVLGREDSVAGLARRLRLVQSHSVKRLLRRALPHGVPSRTEGLLIRAAEVVSTGGGAGDLAAALKVSVRTVPRWCVRADLPPPRRVLAWIRMLLAAELLDDPGRSVSSVARACGYAGESSLKNALRQFFESSATELRERGAFDTVSKRFAAELASIREEAHSRGRSETFWLS